MTPLELIFTALGEELTRKETIKEDAQGFDENKTAALRGGNTAGKARQWVESESGEKVVSSENFIGLKTLKIQGKHFKMESKNQPFINCEQLK